jgi:hypothetical protein
MVTTTTLMGMGAVAADAAGSGPMCRLKANAARQARVTRDGVSNVYRPSSSRHYTRVLML